MTYDNGNDDDDDDDDNDDNDKREIIMCKAPNRVPRQEEYNA